MKAVCEYRNCKRKFSKKVPWQKFCSSECKLAEWAIKEANKAITKKYSKVVMMILFLLFSNNVFAATASWYSVEACRWNKTPDCKTASGKSLYQLEKENVKFAASPSLAFGSRVRVTNLRTRLSTIVRIEDRGPSRRLGREIDLSKSAFSEIADLEEGIIPVKLEVLS